MLHQCWREGVRVCVQISTISTAKNQISVRQVIGSDQPLLLTQRWQESRGVIRARLALISFKSCSKLRAHSPSLSAAMTTGSAITVIVASFMMAMAVELMMPLLLTMHLFSSLATWLRHLLLPPSSNEKGESTSSSWGNKAIASQLSRGDRVKNTLQG